ncbi:hypothetical protein BH20VER1_BH20VER1_08310 [soil metagenome]
MKISERGQITVPKRLRDRFGLKPDTEVEIIEVEHQLVLRKRPASLALDEVRGILRGKATAATTDEILEQTRGR